MLLFGAPMAAAAQGSDKAKVSATVDREEIAQGDSLIYSVRVQAEGQVQMRLVKAPEFGGLRVLGSHQGTEFRSVNGRSQVAYNYQFTLEAVEQGAHTLQGGQAQVNGELVEVPAVTIKVGPPGQKGSPGAGGQTYKGGALALDYILSTDAPYVGQQVLLTYDLLLDDLEVGPFGVDVRDVKTPSFDGFWIEDLSESVQATNRRRRVGGRDYSARAIQFLAIFPLNEGDIVIDPLQMELAASERFGMRRNLVRVQSEAITLKVRPLPPGAPAGFHRGNVGKYEFTVEVDKRRVSAGEPLTVRLTARGQGMVGRVELPRLPERPQWRLLEPVYQKQVGVVRDHVGGSKTAEVVLTPTQEGEVVIPALDFHFFDPDLGRYQTVSSRELRVPVIGKAAAAPAPEQEVIQRNQVEGGSAVQVARQPLHGLRAPEGAEALSDPARSPWLWLGFGAPIALYLGWLGWGALLARRREAGGGRKSGREARKDAEAALSDAAARPPAEAAAEITRALSGWLAAQLDLSPGAVTDARLRRLLPERGVDAALTERLLALRARCEQARFGDTAGVDPQALAAEARQVLTALEAAL